MANPGENSRRLLLERERKQALLVVAEFQKIQDRLEGELFDVLKRIEHARQTEGNAPAGLLIEQAKLRDLFNQVSDEIYKASIKLGTQTEAMQKAAVNVARKQAEDTAELRADLNFFDSPAVRELIGIGGDGKPLDKYFSRLSKPVRQSMFDALYYGISTGKSNQQIAREVNQVVGNGAAAAMTIVRTETNRAYREATRKFYGEVDAVIGWRWLAALDLRTCPICWALHGTIFKKKTAFGTHPNCRCTMVPVFAGDTKKETGPEKFAALTIEQQKTILGPKRLDLYNQGADLANFVETYKSPFGVGRRIIPINRTTFKPNPRTPAPSASTILRTAGTPGPALPAPKPPTTPTPALPSSVTPTPTPTLAIKPGDPVPTFKTAAEASEYFERRFPQAKFDFAGIDTAGGFLQNQADELARLMDLYPETAERLKYFGTYRDKTKSAGIGSRESFRGEYGHAAWSGKYIGVNPHYYQDAAKYSREKARNFATGWTVTDKDQGTVTHEFGHLVDFWLNSIGSEQLTDVGFASHELGSIRELKKAINRKHKPKGGEQSDYSLKNKEEQWAEGFSMYWNRPAAEHSNFARIQAKFIEYVRTRPRFGGKDGQPMREFRDLTDAEKTAARIALNDLYKEFGLTPPFKKKEL
jgi:SPP1 gp7 family putative phage head morphogenesis protein